MGGLVLVGRESGGEGGGYLSVMMEVVPGRQIVSTALVSLLPQAALILVTMSASR